MRVTADDGAAGGRRGPFARRNLAGQHRERRIPMPEETTKLPSGGPPPAARVVDQGRRQLVIAPRRGREASTEPRPLSGGALRTALSQVPGLEVVRVLRSRHVPGVPHDPATEAYVVRVNPDRAEWLRHTLSSQALIEDDVPLEYGTPAGLGRPAPGRRSLWSAAAAVETRPIRFRVVGEGDKSVAGAGVSLTGEGFPQEARADKRGEVTVPLIGLPGKRARSVL